MAARWCLGPTPKSMSDLEIEIIRQLFLDQTGEVYAKESVKTLPIPEWGGNLLLLDENNMIRGLLWANKFGIFRTRVVAFVIDSEFKGKGFGSIAWDMYMKVAKAEGLNEVQLEVRSDNEMAIGFYSRRGLEIIENLDGYYQSGQGYVMRGQL
ncbi:MAG: hypothetical protein CMB16_06865 [Euryarchaeota archaeon]|nr:hypothetical protein [Euryarchaeota archaeon]|tara:strand:- start:3283 stop:3741 length:459 start_codon:yes stop_codon:yes gene_type:complete